MAVHIRPGIDYGFSITCPFTDKGTLHKLYPVVAPRRTFLSVVAITNTASSPVITVITSKTAKGITSTAFHILITSILINATITYVC